MIKIITDSTTSLTKEECESIDIDCVETSYVLDGEEHYAFDNSSETLEDFYKKLDTIKSCSTGCVNVTAFEEIFDKYASQNIQVFYVGLSNALSATFANAEIACKNINEKYKKTMVAVVDSRSASFGTLVLIDYAKEFIAKKGMSLGDIALEIERLAHNMSVAFVARDLTFLQKSGRISALEAGIGKILRIVPIVYVSESGKLKTGDKCIGSKLAFKTLKNKFIKFIEEKHHTKCYITSCGLDDEAEKLKQEILANTKITEIKVGYIDKTLACCCGPKTIAVFSG